MAFLQTLQLEHLPPNHDIHIALYRNVQNAPFLQQQLLDGNTNFEYALIDGSVVRPPFPTIIAPKFHFSAYEQHVIWGYIGMSLMKRLR
jgi:hypothetical protein